MSWTSCVSAAYLALCLSACHRIEPLTEQEHTTVTELTARLKPRCVGRFLIDMPEDALSVGRTKLQGVTVEARKMSQDEYRTAMVGLSKKLNATKSSEGFRFVYADGEIEGIKGSRYFISLGDADAMTDAERLIEAYTWDLGYQIALRISASDARNSTYFKNVPSVRDDPAMTDTPARTRLVFSLLGRIRGREDDEIPTEPGICFMGGFLPSKATAQETVSASFLLHDKHDVGFRVDTDSDIHESDTLLQRTDMDAAIKASDGGTIRKGQIELQGIQQAEEWLSDGLTGAKVRGHYFVLEANSKIGSAATPLVRLDMDNGGRLPRIDGDRQLTQASLTEGEAVALWDAVSRSLRPRPNAF